MYKCTLTFIVIYVMYLQQQDHYAVLGLSKLRYRATEDQIKRACKFLMTVVYLLCLDVCG